MSGVRSQLGDKQVTSGIEPGLAGMLDTQALWARSLGWVWLMANGLSGMACADFGSNAADPRSPGLNDDRTIFGSPIVCSRLNAE